MSIPRLGYLAIIFLVIGCKVQPPQTASKTIQSNQGQDSVKIEVHPIDQVEEIRVFPIEASSISIIGVGDMMLGTNFPNDGYLPPDSGKYLLNHVDSVLISADLTFGNLEGVILNEGGEPKNCKNPDICYIFRSPEYLLQRVADAGFDLLSIANNHSGDFGHTGRSNTGRAIDSLGMKFAGTTESPLALFEHKKIRYGFAAFSPNKGTPQITDLKRAAKLVAHLDSLSDIVIISFHGGAEGKEYMNLTKETEYYYGENRGNVFEFAHSLIDAGADIIFGHGPHVPRAIEVYQNRIIAYSLGNFCTYKRFNLSDENGLAPILQINVNTDGEFLDGKIISTIQTGLGIPKIDSKMRAASLIKKLSEEDFMKAPIYIDPTGVITYIQD